MSLLSPSWPVCGGIAAAAFLAGGWLAWEYQAADLRTCEVKLTVAGRDMTAQTDAAEALAELGANARRAAAEATKRAAEAEAKAKGAEDALRVKIKAPGGPTTCAAAWAEIRRGEK